MTRADLISMNSPTERETIYLSLRGSEGIEDQNSGLMSLEFNQAYSPLCFLVSRIMNYKSNEYWC